MTQSLRALKKHFARQRPTLALDSEASGLGCSASSTAYCASWWTTVHGWSGNTLVEVAGVPAGSLERLRHGLAHQGRRLSPLQGQLAERKPPALRPQRTMLPASCASCAKAGLEVRSIRRLHRRVSLARLPLGG